MKSWRQALAERINRLCAIDPNGKIDRTPSPMWRTHDMKSSLELSDEQSAAVQKTPNRVTLDHLRSKVKRVEYLPAPGVPHMTVCMIETVNGFIIFGQSAPADPDNYDEETGRQFAYDDALRKLWPLEAYLLREALTNSP